MPDSTTAPGDVRGTVFSVKMAAGDIPIEPLLDNEHVFAVRDINPRAPVHVLVIPETAHCRCTSAHDADSGPMLGELFSAAAT